MKTKMMAWAIGAVGMLGMVACSNCKECLKKDMAVRSLCEEDYANPAEYNAAIQAYEADGYNCRQAF